MENQIALHNALHQEIKQIKHFLKVFSSFSFTFGSLSFPLSIENSNQECLKMGKGRPTPALVNGGSGITRPDAN
jgi:hypothetical protein